MQLTLTLTLGRRARTVAAVAALWIASSAGAAAILAGLAALAEHNARAPVLSVTSPGLSPLPVSATAADITYRLIGTVDGDLYVLDSGLSLFDCAGEMIQPPADAAVPAGAKLSCQPEAPAETRSVRVLGKAPRQGVNLFEFTKVAMAREAVLR